MSILRACPDLGNWGRLGREIGKAGLGLEIEVRVVRVVHRGMLRAVRGVGAEGGGLGYVVDLKEDGSGLISTSRGLDRG
jgi:hypothetical protein